MKRTVVIMLLFVTFLSFGHGQEAATQSNIGDQQIKTVSAVDGKPGSYRQSDGTVLNYEEALSRFSQCPENGVVLERMRNWNVVTAISLGTTAFSLAASVVFEILNVDSSKRIQSTMLLSSGLYVLTSLIASTNAQTYRNKAMTNYNFYVMGIPVHGN